MADEVVNRNLQHTRDKQGMEQSRRARRTGDDEHEVQVNTESVGNTKE